MDSMIHLYIGWLGGIMLAICGLPQVIHTYKTKKTEGLSWLFLLFWFYGEGLCLFYLVYSDMIHDIYHFPLYVNYIFNILMVLYLLYAKMHYR